MKEVRVRTVKAGTYIVFTGGEYDSFAVTGLFIAKRTFQYEPMFDVGDGIDAKTFHYLMGMDALEKLDYEEIWREHERK